jgi:hypothetical protein
MPWRLDATRRAIFVTRTMPMALAIGASVFFTLALPCSKHHRQIGDGCKHRRCLQKRCCAFRSGELRVGSIDFH